MLAVQLGRNFQPAVGVGLYGLGGRGLLGGEGGVVHADLLGLRSEELLGLVGARHRAGVGRVRRRLVHLVGVGHDRGDGEAGHGGQVAAEAGLLGGAVEGEALADQHEVLLAGLCHHRADVGHRGVVVVADDLAPVDAALGVAPRDHVLDGVAHLLVEAGETGEAPVVAVGDVDGGVGHTLVRGARGVPLAAGRRERAERGGGGRRGAADPGRRPAPPPPSAW